MGSGVLPLAMATRLGSRIRGREPGIRICWLRPIRCLIEASCVRVFGGTRFCRREGVCRPILAAWFREPGRMILAAGCGRSSAIERLVPVSCAGCPASTSGLSTWWSTTALERDLVLRRVSRLDAFSGYPVRT